MFVECGYHILSTLLGIGNMSVHPGNYPVYISSLGYFLYSLALCVCMCVCVYVYVCLSLQSPPCKLMCGSTSHFSGACLQLSASRLFFIIFGFYSFLKALSISLLMLAHSGFQLQVMPVLFFVLQYFLLSMPGIQFGWTFHIPCLGGLINSPLPRFHLHCLF